MQLKLSNLSDAVSSVWRHYVLGLRRPICAPVRLCAAKVTPQILLNLA